MNRVQVFAYGSNLCVGRMRSRVRSADPRGAAILPVHVVRFHKRSKDGSGKANALATTDAADQVWGVVYELDEAELPMLDRAEGLGNAYDRHETVVEIAGSRLSVFVYIAAPSFIDDRLKPYGWYKRFVVEGARRHGLPREYVDLLDAAESVADPKTDRDREERSQEC
jgi:hypothetical protein